MWLKIRKVLIVVFLLVFMSTLSSGGERPNYMEKFRKEKISEGSGFFKYDHEEDDDTGACGCKACAKAKRENISLRTISGVTIRQPQKEKKYLKDIAEKNLVHNFSTKPAEATAEKFQENYEMQETIAAYKRNIWYRIQKELNSPEGEKWGATLNADQVMDFIEKNRNKGIYEGAYVYIFISSSMPITTIRDTMHLTDEDSRFVYVLRGVIGDGKYIKPTMSYISRLLCGKNVDELTKDDKGDCLFANIDINPVLYKKFHIDRVPAVVYVPDPISYVGCGKEITNDDYYVFFGNAGLSYILDRFQREVGEDPTLDAIRMSLRRSFFAQ